MIRSPRRIFSPFSRTGQPPTTSSSSSRVSRPRWSRGFPGHVTPHSRADVSILTRETNLARGNQDSGGHQADQGPLKGVVRVFILSASGRNFREAKDRGYVCFWKSVIRLGKYSLTQSPRDPIPGRETFVLSVLQSIHNVCISNLAILIRSRPLARSSHRDRHQSLSDGQRWSRIAVDTGSCCRRG